MKENLTGLFLSGLLHAGIIGWAANATYMPQKEKVHVQSHQLTVSLFQAENIIKKSAIKKVAPPAPPKIVKSPPPVNTPAKKTVEVKPELLKKIEPAKPIIVATVATIKPVIEKQQPVIKTETIKAIRQPQDKAIEKPVKKLKQTVKKVIKNIKPKTKKKKKRIRKPIRSKRKIVKKHTVVKRIKKRIAPKKTLKVVAKSRSKARLKPRTRLKVSAKPRPKVRTKIQPKRKTQARIRPRTAPPKRKPVVRAQRRPRTAPVQRRVVRKTPVPRKIVKRGGVINSNKSYKRPSNTRKPVRQQAVQAHNRYRKPAQRYHKSAPVKKASSVNSALIANLNKQYKAQLHQLIASATKKNYPKRAKRRNQQGRVRLSFTISHSGTITNIKIINSSNIAVLDKAAIKTIQKTSHKLPFLSGMSKRALHLTMTVAYVLR